jgi:hypothetical protein
MGGTFGEKINDIKQLCGDAFYLNIGMMIVLLGGNFLCLAFQEIIPEKMTRVGSIRILLCKHC